MKTIDLRSDTVTKPTKAMLDVMANAKVGDDVYGEDPTINQLESLAAEMLGVEASLFVASGTQSNLLALLTHCQRGDEYIAGQKAHIYKFEGGGGAVLGGIQPQPLDFEENGTLDLTKVTNVINPDDFHYARTRLLCLENTHLGKELPMEYLHDVMTFARHHNLKLHLDGARIFNAAIQCNVSVQEIACHFDSVSFCISKGLGAPVGSLFCSNRDQISEARRWRKVLGGGMRQAGILAAGGIYALENNISRLKEDHDNATLLAEGLSEIDGLEVDRNNAKTNIVSFQVDKMTGEQLPSFLAKHSIHIHPGNTIRLVTHLDVSEEDINTVISVCKDFFSAVSI